MRQPTDAALGHYQLLRLLGRGGMGEVFVAVDRRLGRRVALKKLPPHLERDAERRSRFVQEARAAAALNHPGIVTIHTVEEVDGVTFLTMELVDGEPLSDLLPDEGLPVERFLDLAAQLVTAVGVAHEAGITHRDLKPQNVMVTGDGRVKVLDFGLAKATGGADSSEMVTADHVTAAGRVLGTASYMSPEQAEGKPVDPRSDLFSLGIVFYEMITGGRPFRGDSMAAVMSAILRDDPAPMNQSKAGLPAVLEEIVGRCLRKRPVDRYPSSGELLGDLRRLQAELASGESRLQAVASHARSGQLPRILTSFLGRTRELEELRGEMSSARLLTLLGVGGCGKTRLALRLAEELSGEVADGAWWVELGSLRDPALIASTVASALGLREGPRESAVAVIQHHLQSKSLLLVLDNCEHLLDAAGGLVDALLKDCTTLQILATSREPLGVGGETTYAVPPLALPEADDLESVSNSEAVSFFVERARSAKRGFTVTPSNRALVAAVCRRLDGVPLALELAAARMRALALGDIHDRLRDRFRLLRGGSRTELAHHQTLEATVDWSHGLLSEPEQTLFRRLAVFAGGFTLSACESVCAIGPIDDADVVELLAHLVDKSMVVYEEAGGEARYRFLETLHAYARVRLREAAEDTAVCRRHLELFLALTEEAQPQLRAGSERARWVRRLEVEEDNLRAALDEGVADPESWVEGMRLAVALTDFWKYKGRYVEGYERLRALLANSEASSPRRLRAELLCGAAVLANRQGDSQPARRMLEESLAIARELDEGYVVANVLHELGVAHEKEGRLAATRQYHDEALAIRRELGDRAGIAMSLNNLGLGLKETGEHDAAKTALAEGVEICRQLDDSLVLSYLLANMGELVRGEGDQESAQKLHEESLQLRRQCGDRNGVATSLQNLAELAEDRDDAAAARGFLEESLSVRQAIGDRHGVAESLRRLGLLCSMEGDLVAARARAEEALGVAGPVGARQLTCALQCDLARLAIVQGRPTDALALIAESIGIAEEIDSKQDALRGIEAVGAVSVEAGRASTGIRLIAAAETIGSALHLLGPAGDRALGRQVRESARKALAGDEYDEAVREGSSLSFMEALSSALAECQSS